MASNMGSTMSDTGRTDGGCRDVVVIGGSAGAIDPLRTLVRQLPAGFNAAIAVVVHGAGTRGYNLAKLLNRDGPLPTVVADDGASLDAGRIYLAPHGQHLLLDGPSLRLSNAAEVNRARPAIDVLFRSAAETYGPRVIGVILSGSLDDGSAGLLAVRRAGGTGLVQDPREARFPEMPANAIQFALPEAVLPVLDLAGRVVHLVHESLGQASAASGERRAGEDSDAEALSALTCPQCNGALWVRDLDGLLQYRCRTGHVLSQATMVSEQARMVEDALWAAARALEEQCALSNRLAERFDTRGDAATAARHRRQADVSARRAETLRSTLFMADTEPPS